MSGSRDPGNVPRSGPTLALGDDPVLNSEALAGIRIGPARDVCILERSSDAPPQKPQYKLLATTTTSTLQKELLDAGAAGYQVMGMTMSEDFALRMILIAEFLLLLPMVAYLTTTSRRVASPANA